MQSYLPSESRRAWTSASSNRSNQHLHWSESACPPPCRSRSRAQGSPGFDLAKYTASARAKTLEEWNPPAHYLHKQHSSSLKQEQARTKQPRRRKAELANHGAEAPGQGSKLSSSLTRIRREITELGVPITPPRRRRRRRGGEIARREEGKREKGTAPATVSTQNENISRTLLKKSNIAKNGVIFYFL